MTYFKLKSRTQCLLVEKFVGKSVVGRDSRDVVGLTLESGVVGAGAQVACCPGGLGVACSRWSAGGTK